MLSAREQCEQLLDSVIPFAERGLRQHGRFAPFGAIIGPDGSHTLIAAPDGAALPGAQSLIGRLREEFRAAAEERRHVATAICYDVYVVPPGAGDRTDAIAVELDHRDEYSAVVFVPYVRSKGAVALGKAFARPGDGGIFTLGR